MKRFTAIILTAIFVFAVTVYFQKSEVQTVKAMPSPSLVISQFQVAGGGTTPANDEFIELHNTSATSVDLNGYRVVYRSSAGTNDVNFADWTTSTIIPAGGYYLIASTSYDGAATPNFVYNPTTCSCSMSGASGGLAIRNGALNAGTILDSVGYGAATNAFVEGTATAVPAANASQARLNNGCQDTDNNSNDFAALNPSAPRNNATAPNICSGGGTTLFASGSANPGTVIPGGTTLLTVTVTPAANPPSTGITVTGNLTVIGGSASQMFFDDGTNGDATAGDNIFSFQYTIPANATSGGRTIPVTAADAQARTANANISLTINATPLNDNPLLLGNPSNATTDVNFPANYLMVKPQYSLSYHRDRRIPNWVAWRLDTSWLGTADRQDDFRPDETLPAGWYRVTPQDYSEPIYDRGHMVPSGDRTRSIADNSATFLMTNMIPQTTQNNQRAWERLETYCREQAQAGNELYIVSGGAGSIGTIGNGVTIPAVTWKVILILPNGDNDLARVNKNTRTIAVIMPNDNTVTFEWRQYRTSINKVEALTGYDFFSNVSKNAQFVMERRIDTQ